jgi:hypothetical protein
VPAMRGMLGVLGALQMLVCSRHDGPLLALCDRS